MDFVGHLSDRELRAALAAADAVVLPSRYEPFGIVALEAAAAGAPLVASTAGGLGEVVVDGRTGVAFPPGDVAALAAAVDAVLVDPAAARVRAHAARTRLAIDFDWGRIARATAEVYRRARPAEPVELGRPKIATGNAFEPVAAGIPATVGAGRLRSGRAWTQSGRAAGAAVDARRRRAGGKRQRDKNDRDDGSQPAGHGDSSGMRRKDAPGSEHPRRFPGKQ